MKSAVSGALDPRHRYADDTRTMLDLIAYELRRLGLPAGTPLAVAAAYPELRDDLAERLEDQFQVVCGPAASHAAVQVLLWTVEEEHPAAAFPPHAQILMVAFRNRLSHRSLVDPHFHGLWYPAFERRFRQTYYLRAGWGVLGPGRAAWLAASLLANRLRRYDLGYALADRALLAPADRSWWRLTCPQGLLVGRRP